MKPIKYTRNSRLQTANFSCLDELRVDIIENLLSLPKTDNAFEIINIVIEKDKAVKLFNELLISDVNGFSFNMHDDFSIQDALDELKNEDISLVSIDTDGTIWLGRIYPSIHLESDFFYIDNSVDKLWLDKVNDGYNDVLYFGIDE